jgi:hypothetical protein
MSTRIALTHLSVSSPALAALRRVGIIFQGKNEPPNISTLTLLNEKRCGIHQILAVKFINHLTCHNTADI